MSLYITGRSLDKNYSAYNSLGRKNQPSLLRSLKYFSQKLQTILSLTDQDVADSKSNELDNKMQKCRN
jgi:hypothetical protein